jgi:KilA-N domain
MGMTQQELPLIPHSVQGEIIEQRRIDGYVNATAMCKAAGKFFGHYAENRASREFLAALESDIGIPISELVQAVRGGGPSVQGTWVHPQVAINLGQWLSPTFAVQVTKWVLDWMTGRNAAPKLPYHLRRYVKNRSHVPEGHFSILVEMTQTVIAPMEEAGYTLPENMLPDISQGMMFSRMLREELGVDTAAMPYYHHHYEDGRIVPARAYPDEHLPAFRKHLINTWIPQKAVSYFRSRDPAAIEFLPAIYPKAIRDET